MNARFPRWLAAIGVAAVLCLSGGAVAAAANAGVDLLPHPAGPMSAQVTAAELGVTIVWTDRIMCGTVEANGCSRGGPEIEVRNNLNWYQTNWVIYHELGHVLSDRHGWNWSETDCDNYANRMTS